VTVNVTEVRSKLVYVTGEVQRPGAYVLMAPTNVLQIVARAGGVTDFAKTKKVYVFHATGDRIPVNLKDLMRGKVIEQNVLLAPGDTVLIP
jgi:polysaccharide export outer membrane protein